MMPDPNPYEPPLIPERRQARYNIPPLRIVQWSIGIVMLLLVIAILLNLGAMFYLDRIPKSPLALKYRSSLPTVGFVLTAAWMVAFAIVFVLGGILPPIATNRSQSAPAEDNATRRH
jgi:hypothetical protein